MEIQEKLSQYVKSKGIKMSFISEKTGIKYELIRRSLHETRTMTADEFVKIMKSLRLEIKDLM